MNDRTVAQLRKPDAGLEFLADGGEMGALMRAHDWSTSPLGPPTSWPQSLRSVVGLLINSKFPMFVAWGPELGFLYNDGYAEILGGKHPAALGAPFHHVWTDIWPDISPLIDAALSGEATYRQNMPLVTNRKGYDEEAWFTFSCSPVRNEEGGVAGMFCAVSETTNEQARLAEAEAAQREADALYRAYFRNTPEALFVIGVDPEGGFRVEQTNPAHEAAMGMKLEDVRGRRIEELLPTADAERVIGTYRYVVETGTAHQYREVYNHAGSPQHWDTSIVPMRNAHGRIVRLIGSSRDVTRQVVAEEALRQSQKVEAMGQLTGGVAHDFNNLLTPIVGSLDVLQRRGTGDDRERRLIMGALQSAERARLLVQRLLAFARRQPLQPTAVDVGKLIEGMADLIASIAGPQIRVVVDTADDLPPARADANQLEMALLNLGVNARDAMPDGGTLRISATREIVGSEHGPALSPGTYLRLSVADTGIGMDEQVLKRATEPFFSTKGIGKGTGLGLSMAHGLAGQLGGMLTLSSRPGAGTNVDIWLPGADHAAEAEPAMPMAIAEPGAGRVLLVDDEPRVRESTAHLLQELGYEVVEASSAEEALELIAAGLVPDLLITDHLMPGLSGTELVRQVRGIHPLLPALIVSGYADAEGIAPDLPRLAKPFRQADLAASVAALTEAAQP